MNIDQRLEALTGKVEVLFQLQASNESNINRLYETVHDFIEESRETQRRNEQAQRKNEALMAQLMDTTNRLGRIALAHEERISGVEEDRQ